jgi:DNA-binding NtrC family response regulator
MHSQRKHNMVCPMHVFPIHVTPLRERKEDIPLLANHFLDLSVRNLKCARPRPTRAAVLKYLPEHDSRAFESHLP